MSFFYCQRDSKQKRNQFFKNIIGATAYRLLHSLLVPEEPEEKSLNDLMKLLKGHYKPKHNIVAETFHFHRREQKPGESLTNLEYVAELGLLAANCSFDCAYIEEVL